MRKGYPTPLWLQGKLFALLVVVLVLAACGAQVYFLYPEAVGFNSDKAIFGLDAVRMMHGKLQLYSFPVSYVSSAYAFAAVPFLFLFGQSNVLALYAPFLLSIFLTLIVHTLLVQRLWGRSVAVLSLLILALPNYFFMDLGFFVHYSISMPLAAVSLLLVTGTLMQNKKDYVLRLCIVGVLLGLNLWVMITSSIFLVTVVTLLLFSKEKWQLICKQLGVLLLGCVVGALPLLIGILSSSARPFSQVHGVLLPSFDSLWSTFTLVLPTLLGVRPIYGYAFLWWVSCGILLLALLAFFYEYRKECVAPFQTMSLGEKEIAVYIFLLPALLFCIALFFRPAVNPGQARYALMALPSLSVLIALGLLNIVRRWSYFGISVILALVMSLSIPNSKVIRQSVLPRNIFVPSHTAAAIHAFMQEHDVHGGFSDYWTSYAMMFLMGEQNAISPYRSRVHYPEYEEQALSLHKFVVIFGPNDLRFADRDTRSVGPLSVIDADKRDGSRNEKPYEKIQRSSILDHQYIDAFEVWYLEDPTP
ncbi:MAG: hypothetical protein O3A81_00885 [bacterium]|nr:hypothetical protein [bacterium]